MDDGRRMREEGRAMWSIKLSSKSSFCRAVVASGFLTQRQMVHAALRYRLGCSKDDAVIYWQIDQLGQTHDGKLMWYGADCHRLKNRHATWVSHLLKRHYAVPDDAFQPVHCFFGLHLLNRTEKYCPTEMTEITERLLRSDSFFRQEKFSVISNISVGPKKICLVEAEKTAVICSELYPQYTWLAAGGMNEVQVNKFFPLRHHKVILFPDTDPDSMAFTRWYDAAQEVMKSFFWPNDNPIRVSPLLERHATPDQKRRKIDLVDFLFEKRHYPPPIVP